MANKLLSIEQTYQELINQWKATKQQIKGNKERKKKKPT